MDDLKLSAKIRDLQISSKKLRKAGIVPGELYGHNLKNLHLSLNASEFKRVFKKAGESTIVQLLCEDGSVHKVLIHDLQRDVLTYEPIHVDFLEVSMTEKLRAHVALEFVGESLAVKAMGATLVKLLSTVEVESLPQNLPHNISVDIGKLAGLTDTICVKELSVPNGVKVLTHAEELVAKVQPPRDVEAELAEPVVEDVSKVEVIKPEKKEEEVQVEEK